MANGALLTRRALVGLGIVGSAAAVCASLSHPGADDVVDPLPGLNGDAALSVNVPDVSEYVRPRDLVAGRIDPSLMGVVAAPVGAVGADSISEVYDSCHLVHTKTLVVDGSLVPSGTTFSEMWSNPDMGPLAVLTQYDGITTLYGLDGCEKYAALFDASLANGISGEVCCVVCAYDDDEARMIDCDVDTASGVIYIPRDAFFDADGTEVIDIIQIQIMVRVDCSEGCPSGYVFVSVDGDVGGGNDVIVEQYVPFSTFDTQFSVRLAGPSSGIVRDDLCVYVNDMDLPMLVNGDYADFDAARGVLTLYMSPVTLTCVRVHVERDVVGGLASVLFSPRLAHAATTAQMRAYPWGAVEYDDSVAEAAGKCQRFTWTGTSVSMFDMSENFTGDAAAVRRYVAKNYGKMMMYVYSLTNFGYWGPLTHDVDYRDDMIAWLDQTQPGADWWTGILAKAEAAGVSSFLYCLGSRLRNRFMEDPAVDISESEWEDYVKNLTWQDVNDVLNNSEYWKETESDGHERRYNFLRVMSHTIMLPSSSAATNVSGFKSKSWFEGIKSVSGDLDVVAIPAGCAHVERNGANNSVYTGTHAGHVLEVNKDEGWVILGFATGSDFGGPHYGGWEQASFSMLKVPFVDDSGFLIVRKNLDI